MKKLLLTLALVFVTHPAFAANTINATIYTIDSKLKLYEVCGSVTGTGDLGGLRVDIAVDSGTKNAGAYSTHTAADGKFCQIVRVIGTQISVLLIEPLAPSPAPAAVVPVP